jgi:hypothetical protein
LIFETLFPVKRLFTFAIVVTTLCLALVACNGSDPTPIATVDLDATVRVSVEQTTVAKEAIESTVAAAISATSTARASQVVSTPTPVPVPTTEPTPVPTATAVSSGIEVTDFTCVVLYPGIPLLEGDTINLAAN